MLLSGQWQNPRFLFFLQHYTTNIIVVALSLTQTETNHNNSRSLSLSLVSKI